MKLGWAVIVTLAIHVTAVVPPVAAGSRDPSSKSTDAVVLIECNAALSLPSKIDGVRSVILTDHSPDPKRGKFFVREFEVPLVWLKRRTVRRSQLAGGRTEPELDYQALVRVTREKHRDLLDAIRSRKALTVIGLVHGSTLHGNRPHDQPTAHESKRSIGADW